MSQRAIEGKVKEQEKGAPDIERSYLKMPYNKYLWLRLEFMSMCDDEHEAMIMRVIEYEIEGDRHIWMRTATELIEQGKPIPDEPEWWIALSHKQIMARLYKAIKNEKTLRAKLQSLIEKKFLLMRQNPNNLYGSPQYTINKDLVQEKLDELPPLLSVRDAAKSQTTLLPKLVPPPKTGTPSTYREEGPPQTGRRDLPKVAGGRYQTREEGPPKTGIPYKKEEREEAQKPKEREKPTVIEPAAVLSFPPSSEKSFQRKETVQVAHPIHNFLFLDDVVAPTTLTVYLTSKEFESDLEDKRRGRLAQEVKWELEARRHNVKIEWKRETEGKTIETSVSPAPIVAHSPTVEEFVDPREYTPEAKTPMDSLTDEQADFWRRWCAVRGCGDAAFNEKLLPDLTWLASRVTSTADLESLYQSDCDMLMEMSKQKGTKFTAPWLSNLVKHYPTWKAAHEIKQKARERERDQGSQKALPGTGQITNWTQDRLSGAGVPPPLDYTYATKQDRKPGNNMGIRADLFAWREKLDRKKASGDSQ